MSNRLKDTKRNGQKCHVTAILKCTLLALNRAHIIGRRIIVNKFNGYFTSIESNIKDDMMSYWEYSLTTSTIYRILAQENSSNTSDCTWEDEIFEIIAELVISMASDIPIRTIKNITYHLTYLMVIGSFTSVRKCGKSSVKKLQQVMKNIFRIIGQYINLANLWKYIWNSNNL